MTPQTNSQSSIHARALLVWLTISTWAARKYDRVVSDKLNADYHASTKSARVNKFLLPDCPEYTKLTALSSAVRAEHYTRTLSWSDEGWRLLPTAAYGDYVTWYRQRSHDLQQVLDAFVIAYPAACVTASAKLGKLHKPADYPSTQDIRSRFSLQIEYAPLPAVGDVRVDLSADQIADIEGSIANRLQSATQIAIGDCYSRLYSVVAKIADKLKDKDAIFRDSLIENARELCAMLPILNVTNDPDLARMTVRVSDALTQHDPDVLRDTPKVRRSVAAEADAILSAMSGLFEVA